MCGPSGRRSEWKRECSADTRAVPRVKQKASGNALPSPGSSAQGSVKTWGWGGEWEGGSAGRG